MRLPIEDAEKIIPRWSPTRFTKEQSAFENEEVPQGAVMDMLQLDGWKILGWAYSMNVRPREMCPYVCMFENEDGFQAWCHVATTIFQTMAFKVQNSP